MAKCKGPRRDKKAEARLRIKERWFDDGTAAYERVFPGARARDFPNVDNPYVCPLCWRPFPRAAIVHGTLTFEDAPPKSYGGKPVALTCKPCNNSLGSSLDAPLSTLDSAEMSPCCLGIDGVEAKAYQENPGRRKVLRHTGEAEQSRSHGAFFGGLDGKPTELGDLQLTFKWDVVKRRRADLAWLKAAYMVTFATWGYSYAFSPALRVVREQLLHPDDEIIRQFKLENRSSPRDTRFLIYIREPGELKKGVAVGMGPHHGSPPGGPPRHDRV